jgi:hypothetical protein
MGGQFHYSRCKQSDFHLSISISARNVRGARHDPINFKPSKLEAEGSKSAAAVQFRSSNPNHCELYLSFEEYVDWV